MEQWHCCRTCLSVQNLKLIFPIHEHSEKYSDVIFSATGIKVHLNDSLSQLMCIQCINFINEIYKFRKKCEDVQTSLLDQLNKKQPFEIKIELNEFKSDVVASIDISSLLIDNDFRDYDDNITLSEYYIEIERSKQLETIQNVQHNDNLTENTPTSEPTIKNHIHNIQPNDNVTETCTFEQTKKNHVIRHLRNSKLTKNKERTAKKRGRTKKENQEEKRTKEKKERVKEEIECELCHKILTSKLSLRNHNKIHSGFDVVCEHCGKKFITRRLLLMHCKAKHGYEKTDKCSYCDYRASNAEQVKIHERLHTGEKPYACSCCGASFHRKSSYLQHVAIHLPDKTVQCDQCPARFKSTTLMRIHRARHRAPQYTYKCRVCDNTFARRRNVVRHLLRIHSLQAESQHIDRTKCS